MIVAPDAGEDAALVARALAGDDRAFAALMSRYKEWLYRFIRRYVGDADEAYDLLQETFIAAWTGLSSYNQGRALSVWLRRIALNKCRDWSRRRLVRNFFYGAESIDHRAERLVAGQDATSGSGEALLRRLDLAIAALPPSLKEPLLLTAFEGMTHKEAGDMLGVSAKAIETRIRRAKAALSLFMEKESSSSS